MDKHIATLEELELIESVLKGYPASMARGDAIRAVGSVRAAIALMRGQSEMVIVAWCNPNLPARVATTSDMVTLYATQVRDELIPLYAKRQSPEPPAKSPYVCTEYCGHCGCWLGYPLICCEARMTSVVPNISAEEALELRTSKLRTAKTEGHSR